MIGKKLVVWLRPALVLPFVELGQAVDFAQGFCFLEVLTVVALLGQNPERIADRDYAKLVTRAKSTRALDFKKLIELGLVERKGKGKATYYTFFRPSRVILRPKGGFFD